MYSDALKKFKELIRNDNKWPPKSKKFENERRDLLFWFVDNCPSKEGPENAKRFDDYGICWPRKYTELKNRILEVSNTKKTPHTDSVQMEEWRILLISL